MPDAQDRTPEQVITELSRELQRYKNRAARYEGERVDRAHYSCAESLGEAQALRHEEHLCSDCVHLPVCAIAAAVERCEEFAPVIFRCGAYLSIISALESRDAPTPNA